MRGMMTSRAGNDDVTGGDDDVTRGMITSHAWKGGSRRERWMRGSARVGGIRGASDGREGPRG